MNKLYLLISLVILGLIAFVSLGIPIAASADSTYLPICQKGEIAQNTSVCKNVSIQNGSNTNVVIEIIKDVINVLSYITGTAAVIMLVVGGIRFVTSGGDSSSVAGAKKSIVGALVGVVIVVLAQTIVIFVLNSYK